LTCSEFKLIKFHSIHMDGKKSEQALIGFLLQRLVELENGIAGLYLQYSGMYYFFGSHLKVWFG
jgi:hypothetical protein